MPVSRFYFVEPSKVGPQHITLIEGYLRALVSSQRIADTYELIVCTSRSTFENLSPDLQTALHHRTIPVMNPEQRRLVLKTFVEFFVVLRYVLALRKGDLLFVSCILPTTLLAIEFINMIFRRQGLYVTVHGEVEGLFDKSLQKMRSYGYWVLQWLRIRRPNSLLSLVVIDDFIKRRLLAKFPGKLKDNQITVVYHPVTAFAETSHDNAPANVAVCFIGYRTPFKGFDHFEQLARKLSTWRFVAIGGGQAVDIPSDKSTPLDGNDAYMNAIAACGVALFPYVGGYSCSLSAAVLDALSAGVHVVATRRGCFVSLAEHFGPDVVTIIDTPEDAVAILGNTEWVTRQRAGRTQRLQRLSESRYGIDGVRACFERLAIDSATNA
jgi:glycosyltransferase involved in cell wall biosynthesis